MKILLTDGEGMLGLAVNDELKRHGATNISVASHKEYDLREKDAVIELYRRTKPDLVIHTATKEGNVAATQKNPASYFFDNAIMGIQLIEYARQFGVTKFVSVGSTGEFPKFVPLPLKEEELWNGPCDEDSGATNMARKLMMYQGQCYQKQ